ncbi:hypothetical protein L0337_39710 [candidate division KSB1 bacterium]|nr:hypothetical protein [candidate division KSB1 bacterium]
MSPIRFKILTAGILILGLLFTACEKNPTSFEPQAIKGSFAGKVEGTDAFIALVTNGKRTITFYCDGKPDAPPAIYGWFDGNVKENRFNLTNAMGDKLVGEFKQDAASFTLNLGSGKQFGPHVERVTGKAGLWRAEETINGITWIGGWILLPNGEQRGALRVAVKRWRLPSWIRPVRL